MLSFFVCRACVTSIRTAPYADADRAATCASKFHTSSIKVDDALIKKQSLLCYLIYLVNLYLDISKYQPILL